MQWSQKNSMYLVVLVNLLKNKKNALNIEHITSNDKIKTQSCINLGKISNLSITTTKQKHIMKSLKIQQTCLIHPKIKLKNI